MVFILLPPLLNTLYPVFRHGGGLGGFLQPIELAEVPLDLHLIIRSAQYLFMYLLAVQGDFLALVHGRGESRWIFTDTQLYPK